MNDPNPDDPLMEEISQQYKSDRRLFRETATRWTQRHAIEAKPEVGLAEEAVEPRDEEEETNKDIDEKSSKSKDNDNRVKCAFEKEYTSSINTNAASFKTSSRQESLPPKDFPLKPSSSLKPSASNQSSSKPSAKPSASNQSSSKPSNLSSTKAASTAAASDLFDDSFDEDDDFIEKTPDKKSKKENEDSFSEMNDSDLDLFDFDESPVKKKKKSA